MKPLVLFKPHNLANSRRTNPSAGYGKPAGANAGYVFVWKVMELVVEQA